MYKDFCIGSTTEKLLFNIQELLKEQNGLLNGLTEPGKDPSGVTQPNKELEPTTGLKKAYVCKVCNTEYENKGKYLACLKKHKKDGGANANGPKI